MDDLNIMTRNMTEQTRWLHSNGSAPKQGGFCLGVTSVLHVFVPFPKHDSSQQHPTVNSYVTERQCVCRVHVRQLKCEEGVRGGCTYGRAHARSRSAC